jgi:AraC-like DNA-binding protein
MLVETSESIKSIALLCGYSKPGNYIRDFRALVGNTPLEHRIKSSMGQQAARAVSGAASQ